ncbi:hypothetical protein TGRUB_254855B, partial [Toxoplasma gondii RUB]
ATETGAKQHGFRKSRVRGLFSQVLRRGEKGNPDSENTSGQRGIKSEDDRQRKIGGQLCQTTER